MGESYGQKQEGNIHVHLGTFGQLSMLYARMVCSECDSPHQPYYIVLIYNSGNTGKREIYQLDD